MAVDLREVEAVLPPDVYGRVVDAVQRHPNPNELVRLFNDIAQYAKAPHNRPAVAAQTTINKKRKLEDGSSVANTSSHQANGTTPSVIAQPTLAFECKDVSVQIPARKKLKLQVVIDAHDQRRQEVRLQNQQSSEVEYSIPASSVDQVFCLPVPEKQQRQWSFVLFPKVGAVGADGMPCEQAVFTMNETPPVGVSASQHAVAEEDTFVTVTESELNRLLQHQSKQVIRPSVGEFASSIPQAHRKGEKAYHVKAHRGSKEGYLFFLENGVVFGFKKPLAFFPFSSIDSISYTSVLQRTFNLVIAAREAEDADPKEIEFSMLDQADFAGIDEYVKRHGLNDASMAAQRRAKAYNVNKDKKAEANGDATNGAAEDDGRTELQKAEEQLQDEEDEEEEDYVASGGESEGSGDYSEDEEEEYGDVEDEEGAEEVEHEEDVHDE